MMADSALSPPSRFPSDVLPVVVLSPTFVSFDVNATRLGRVIG